MRLFIIGNGFDLHHGLDTRYVDYRDYLKQYHPTAFQLIDSEFRDMADSDALWSEMENTLGKTCIIDVKSKYKEILEHIDHENENKQRKLIESDIERLSEPRE